MPKNTEAARKGLRFSARQFEGDSQPAAGPEFPEEERR